MESREVDQQYNWWMYPPQLLFLEGRHPQCIAGIEPSDVRPFLHLGSSFLMRGREMRFLELHSEELGILLSIACSLAALAWQGLLGYTSHICRHSDYFLCKSSSYRRSISQSTSFMLLMKSMRSCWNNWREFSFFRVFLGFSRCRLFIGRTHSSVYNLVPWHCNFSQLNEFIECFQRKNPTLEYLAFFLHEHFLFLKGKKSSQTKVLGLFPTEFLWLNVWFLIDDVNLLTSLFALATETTDIGPTHVHANKFWHVLIENTVRGLQQ